MATNLHVLLFPTRVIVSMWKVDAIYKGPITYITVHLINGQLFPYVSEFFFAMCCAAFGAQLGLIHR